MGKLAVSADFTRPCDKGEPVIAIVAQKESEDSVGLLLVNETGNEIAQTDPIALEINLAGNADLQHGNNAAIRKRDTGDLGGRYNVLHAES